MKRSHIITAMALMTASMAVAQSELPEEAPNEAAVLKNVRLDFPNNGRDSKKGTGMSANTESLVKALPKKVALVAFYTFDPGCTKSFQFSPGDYKYTHKKTLSSQGNSALICEGMYYSGIENMKEKFKSYGMELLTPEQFLDTPEKKEYYNNLVVPHSKASMGEIMKGQNLGSKENDQFGYMEGYNVLNIVAEPRMNYQSNGALSTVGYGPSVMDKKVFAENSDEDMTNALGKDLAQKLGVDAVVIVYATIYVPKDTKIMLQNINMTMFGPNPFALPDGTETPKNYNGGVFYCGTRFQPDVAIWNFKKKEPETAKLDFTGFNEVLGALSTKMGDYLTGKED